MGSVSFTNKIVSYFKKYKYAFLILFIGIILMNIPEKVQPEISPQGKHNNPESIQHSLSDQLEQILSHIDGVGRVEVLLTVDQGAITYYQENTDKNITTDSTSLRTDVVTITDAERNETGLVVKKDPEIYRGATIVCQGAEKPSVKLHVIEAVSKVTGLGANQICVLKMK